jgi:hypothetical protein
MSTSFWRNPVAIGIAALLLLILAASTFAVVPETKQAVVYRLAQPIRVINAYKPGQGPGNSEAGPIVRVPFLQVVNLIVTPLAMAAAMIAWEQWLAKWRGRRSPGAADFVNRYAFALCYLLVRFFFAARGAA